MSLLNRGLVLDTNTLTHLTKPTHARYAVAQQVFADLVTTAAQQGYSGPLLMVPTIVLFEAKRGMLKTGATRQQRELERFLEAYGLLVEFDEDAATDAAHLWAHAHPRHNDDNDLMILGTAIALDADLITEDSKISIVPRPAEVRLWTWDTLAAELAEEEE